MATLTVNGAKVTVDDSFLKLSPADQEKTVNEIAASMPKAPSGPPAGAVPGSKEYADWARQQAIAGNKLPQVGPAPVNFQQPTSPADQVMAGYTSAVDAVPIAGPMLRGGLQNLKAGMYGVPQDQIAAEDQRRQDANPGASMAGAVTGTVLPFLAGGEIPIVARALGMSPTAGLLGNTLASAGSSAAISGLDTLARGGDAGQALKDAGIGGAIGAVIPGAGAAVRGIGRAIPRVADWTLGGVPGTLKNAMSTERAAQKAVGRAMTADAKSGLSMTAAEDAAASSGGLPIVNMDRGGPATRRLARVAAAGSPEAKATLESATERGTPSLETTQFLTKLVGGSADDLALRDGLDKAARLANGPAYAKAEAAPAAQSIFTPEIQQLMYAPEFLQAVREAEGSGKTWAARFGGKPVQSPFVFAADGTVSMKPGVTPNLKFWDQVQRSLRAQSEALGPQEATKAAALKDLRSQLLNVLDTAVPDFKTARQGAAQFFGAENALDAGRQFALQPRNLPEAMKAFNAMNPVDQKAFAIGSASSVIDKLKTGNTYAVVKSTFGTPAAKEFWRGVLGPAKAEQLEAFVKVQGLMEESKRAIQGGSQTYDLMVAGGLGAAGATGSYFAPGNNLSTAAYFVAALRAGRTVLGRHVDSSVAEKVANLLASGDKAALNKVIANATMSPKWQVALDTIVEGTAAMARGAGVNAVRSQAVAQ